MKVSYVPIMPTDNAEVLPRSATNSPVEEDITNYYSREKLNPGNCLALIRLFNLSLLAFYLCL